MKRFLHRLFRKDLHLSDRVWHRLFAVLFVVAYLIIFMYLAAPFLDGTKERYVVVDKLEDRLTQKLSHLDELYRPGEKIAAHEWMINGMGFGIKETGKYNYDIYCSSDITSHVDKIFSQTRATAYKGDLLLVSKQEFIEYLREMGANCVEELELDNKKLYGDHEYALNWWVDESVGMHFLKKSWIKTFLSLSLEILFLSLGFIVVMVIYYQIVLYILFGTYKSDCNQTDNNKKNRNKWLTGQNQRRP